MPRPQRVKTGVDRTSIQARPRAKRAMTATQHVADRRLVMISKHAFSLLIGLALPLCTSLAAEVKPPAGKQIVIGVSVPVGDYWLFAKMKEGAEAEAAALGVKVLVFDAHFSPETQVRDMARLVASHVDGILLTPMPTGSLREAIDAAVAAGIPVVKVLSNAAEDKALLAIGADAVQGGRMGARFVIEKLGNKGSVIVLDDPKGSSLHAPFVNAFDEELKTSNVKVLVREPTDWYRGKVRNIVTTLLAKYPQFDAVFAMDDMTILGAIDAMYAANVDPETKVTVGWDATAEAVLRVQEGALSATFDQLPAEQAKQGLRYLVDYIRNKKAPRSREILLAPQLVTKQPQG
jgi:ribose transport system substrate-binding protein